MYYNYLDLAERLNATLPNEEDRYAKIYVWTHRNDKKKHGVEICICGAMKDVAVDCKRKDMIPNVLKAYGIITKELDMNNTPTAVQLRNGRVVSINN